ncbi:XdhC family protein [Microvirga sp. 2TAF3]|uniref:XdhC family protein n=1 Tax=Microvirga sp. 2TAF3 TaxID=3233014 RepID=UPI003F97119E
MEIAKADWPDFGLSGDMRPMLASALQAGEDAVLVTLYGAIGGSPRGLGAQMLVTRNSISGYLSGGCIETDVTHHALAVLGDGQPRRLVYGQGGPVDIRLPCGGRLELLVERVRADDQAAHRLLELSAHRETALWVSDGNIRTCLSQAGSSYDLGDIFQSACFSARSAGEKAGQYAQSEVVYRWFEPRQRLVVLGHDPTALAMATLAQQVGMEVLLVRPKGPPTLPLLGVRYLRQTPSKALQRIGLDPWTAVAVAMHQEDDDHEALVAALSSRAGYIGLLGSSRRLPRIFAHLAEAGISSENLSRLKAPIGLDIGGYAPWEIAISVIAEVIQSANAVRAMQSLPDQAAA